MNMLKWVKRRVDEYVDYSTPSELCCTVTGFSFRRRLLRVYHVLIGPGTILYLFSVADVSEKAA